jgi:hypothetical protein
LISSIGIFRLLASLFGMSLCHIFLLQSLDPQYSLSSSNYSSLDMCIVFHSYIEKYTLYGGTHIILAFQTWSPFWQSMPMGEKFREFIGEVSCFFVSCFGFVPKQLHLIRMHYWLLHCMVMHNSLYKLS